MNNVTAAIEARLTENKNGVKTYASYQFADAKGENIGKACQTYYDTKVELRYIVVYLPTFKRFTTVFLFSEFMRAGNVGGYVGYISDEGFWSV